MYLCSTHIGDASPQDNDMSTVSMQAAVLDNERVHDNAHDNGMTQTQ